MKNSFGTGVLITVAGVLLIGCGNEDALTADSSAPERDQATVVITPQFDSAEAEATMNRPLDGSSVEAFESGLAQVKSLVPPEDYDKIQSALDWMLFYDFSVAGSKSKLYAKLDGETPLEIIARSERRKDQ
jgi:hypothetical protein